MSMFVKINMYTGLLLLIGCASADLSMKDDIKDYKNAIKHYEPSKSGIINKKAKNCDKILDKLINDKDVNYVMPSVISNPFDTKDVEIYTDMCPKVKFQKHIFCDDPDLYSELNNMD